MRSNDAQPVAWIDAAWAALSTGEPRELELLERLMRRGPMHLPEGLDASELRWKLRRLEMLLAATARNLRVMRGQPPSG